MYINNMKRTYTLLSIFTITLMAFAAKAQDLTPHVKSYIDFYGGISTPLGSFGQANYSNNEAGYAKQGVAFSLDGAVYVYKNLAIGVTFSFQDQGEMNYNDVLNIATGYTSSYNADESDVTANNRYHNWNILIGPQYSFTYKRFILDLRASAGIIKSSSTPEVQTNETGVLTQTVAFYQNNSTKTIFGYGGNVGLRYKLGDSWSVGIKGAYIDSQGLDVTSTGRTVYVGRNVTKIPITEFQTTIGFALSF
jgi:opacity protein-like surface antigen